MEKELIQEFDVAIVGAGPAGLSASIYSAQANFSTVVFNGGDSGGLLTTTETINNYLGFQNIGGEDLAEAFLNHSRAEGVAHNSGKIIKIEKVDEDWILDTEDGSRTRVKAVVYAAGSTPKKLGLPNEDMEGVSYCATCDGMFYEGDNVSVVGGGDAALEEALYLSRIASTVNLLVRSEIRAKTSLQKLVKDCDNIVVRKGVQVSSIEGSDDGLEKVHLSNGEVLDSYGLFIAIGQKPNSLIASQYSELDDNNFITFSKEEGFFVAGDVRNPDHRQVVIAAGDGARAAIDMTNYLLMKNS